MRTEVLANRDDKVEDLSSGPAAPDIEVTGAPFVAADPGTEAAGQQGITLVSSVLSPPDVEGLKTHMARQQSC